MVTSETALKAKILTHGVVFSDEALSYSISHHAKIQNNIYNLPKGSNLFRPQELRLIGKDNYPTVVSCVSPKNREPIKIDVINDELVAIEHDKVLKDVKIEFVREPDYYKKTISNGEILKKYVSSCGYDELNIMPWSGCAISRCCLFCGVNTVTKGKKDELTAFSLSKYHNWDDLKDNYLKNLDEALAIAKDDECFKKHMHLILISGDLTNDALDYETNIYCDIANNIYPIIKDKTSEGIVAVIMPPNDLDLLYKLKESHVEKVVFNLEVGNEPWFSKFVPGKSTIGRNHIIEALTKAIDIFGYGNVWTNFVLGLEPIDELLKFCEKLCSMGICPSANVLHIDEGNRCDGIVEVPTYEDVLKFFKSLSDLYKKYNLKPYYCQEALRTSVSNEAYADRIGDEYSIYEK